MSTNDNIFVAASVEVVAGWLAGTLDLAPVASPGLKEGERLFRRAGHVGAETVAIMLRPNGFVDVDPEPEDIQAIDKYPVDLNIWLIGSRDEDLQLRETRSMFDTLVTRRPDVPVLLVHNLDTLVVAYLPGKDVHTFDPKISPDVEDFDTWRPWVLE
jgi:hypothetical protein